MLGVGLIVAFANRPAPRTSGIVEMSPSERARYHQSIGKVIEDLERKQGLRAPEAPPVAVDASGEGGPRGVDSATIEELEAIFARKRARDAKASGPSHDTPARGSHTTTP